jgi:hypothetical protein
MSKKPSKKLLLKRKAFLALFYCFYDVCGLGDEQYEIHERETNQAIGYIVFKDPSGSKATHPRHSQIKTYSEPPPRGES